MKRFWEYCLLIAKKNIENVECNANEVEIVGASLSLARLHRVQRKYACHVSFRALCVCLVCFFLRPWSHKSVGLFCNYFDRDTEDCQFLYSVCTFWPCRSPGNVLWEFECFCLDTDKSSVQQTHAFSKDTSLVFRKWKSIEGKEASCHCHCYSRLSKMSHTVSMGPHRHCTIGENLEKFPKDLFP